MTMNTDLKKIVRIMQAHLGPRSVKARQVVEAMMSSLQVLFEKLASDFNNSISQEPLMVTVRRPKTGEEDIERLIVSTSFWALSIRGSNGTVEFFTVPATELPSLRSAELPSRAKLRFIWSESISSETSWTLDGLPVSGDELGTLMRTVFKDLVIRSKGDFEQMPESMRLLAGAQSLTRSVRSLLGEKHALVQKIVNQQEAIQNQVARDLHDAVLGNVMLLKRSLSPGAKRMPDPEMVEILNEIATRLRDLCQDLSPRDLKDCGLQPMLEELCHNMCTRTEVSCEMKCPVAIPDFPDEVSLHVYRIAQECFNNIASHAGATAAELSIQVQNGLFTMIVQDDGKGFNVEVPSVRTKDGGSGTSIIRERAEMIECIYPTRVWINSQPGSGTRMTLEIMYASASDKK